MPNKNENNTQEDKTSHRKKEHLELCLTNDVQFKSKTTGFDKYDFVHYAITEVELDKISFETKLFKKKISYPFIISCMTGGAGESEDINEKLSSAAQNLNIAIGVGSQRQSLENKKFINSYAVIRKNAPSVPVFGNIGAAQLVQLTNLDAVQNLVDQIEADAMVVHVNPLQELLQTEGEPNFSGLLNKIEKIVKLLNVPIIVKEVGAGISKRAAKELLEVGVKGIDVAGAGGTSWAGVEILRNKNKKGIDFWDWGISTSQCIKKVSKLKKKYKFILFGSGGINSSMDAAKAVALGADIVGSARIILQTLNTNGIDGVVNLIQNWFEFTKSVMFLTGSQSLSDLRKNKIFLREKSN